MPTFSAILFFPISLWVGRQVNKILNTSCNFLNYAAPCKLLTFFFPPNLTTLCPLKNHSWHTWQSLHLKFVFPLMSIPPHMSIPTQTRVWHPAVTSSNSQNSEVSCVPMCSRGVLRGGKSDGAAADGDDELHPRLPHLALGGHGDALLETSLLDCCPCHSSHSCWIQVSWELVRCPTVGPQLD